MGIELSKTIEKQLSDENMSIEQVVMGIFKGNPNDIGDHYKYQKGVYTKLLYQENKNSFEIRGEDTILVKNNLQMIPCYKQP